MEVIAGQERRLSFEIVEVSPVLDERNQTTVEGLFHRCRGGLTDTAMILRMENQLGSVEKASQVNI
jgi:hypothetical protein